jgi:hypothetical protein
MTKLTDSLACVTIPRTTHYDLKLYALKHNMTIYEVLDKAFRALEREEKQNNKK